MRLLIFLMATFSFPSLVHAKCEKTDIVGAVEHVDTGTTVPVMITPISEINSFPLQKGNLILSQSEIVTDATSRVRIVFVDGTYLNVGPNSRVLIDEYVFKCNPSQKPTNAFKGFLRAVQGQISKDVTQDEPNRQSTTTGLRG